MEQKEIEEGNVLIALFMGAVKSKMDGDSRYLRFKEPIGKTYAFYPKDLKYHSSWDWLMPVVEKIYNSRYHIKIEVDSITIANNNHYLSPIAYRLFTPDKLIEALWSSVVEFIKWYNSLTPKP